MAAMPRALHVIYTMSKATLAIVATVAFEVELAQLRFMFAGKHFAYRRRSSAHTFSHLLH